MTTRTPLDASRISRREFLDAAARGSLVLLLGAHERRIDAAIGLTFAGFAPNQWIAIGQDGTVTLRAHKSEMGQGARTAIPAILAAELGADWPHVRIVHAEPGPDFPDMGTSGSSSVPDSWLLLRRAAAVARTMLIDAAAARWQIPARQCVATESRVVDSVTGRFLTFGALVPDAAQRAIPRDAPLLDGAKLTLLGRRLHRTDAPLIVRGRAEYGIDVRVPGMRFAVLDRPPVAGATIAHTNETAARAVPGVERIVRTPSGIAVVAANSWAAMRGRAALGTQWANADRANATTAAFMSILEQALDRGTVSRREGDVGAALSRAARRLEATYRMPFQAHAAMEPLTCTASVRAGRCEVWVGTQRPNGVQKLAAQLLGIPEDRVTVHVVLMGGAFGRRIATDHAREAIELSQAIGQPVQLVWTREDDLSHDMYQSAQINRITAGLNGAGEIVAWKQQSATYNLSMFGPLDPNANPADDGDPWGGYDNPYVFPAFDVTLATIETPVPTGAWRSVTYPGGVFARESFLDELARATSRDPLELRLALLAKAPNEPARRNAARTAGRLSHVLRLAGERAGWGTPFDRVRSGRRWGRGLACNPYGSGAMVAQVAEVSVGEANDIRVHHVTTAIDVGRVIDRSGLEAQVEGGVAWALSAALKTEVTFANGRAQQTNFDRFPVLRLREMPAQDIVVVESELGPFGAGEPPVPAVYAAVANAVYDATGERVRETPIRLAHAH